MLTDWEWLFAGVDRVWAPVATPLGLALALLVTGHALLTKRDVAASIGWMGLAWVAPVWGALFYFLLGINRVTRRAQAARPDGAPRHEAARLPRRDYALHLKPLDHAVRRLTNRAAVDDNVIEVLSNGEETYPAMLAGIAGAEASIALSTYIMRNDAVGRQFAEALKAAKARGVVVRVLLDGVGSGYFPAINRVLRKSGIPSALFMHSAMPWRMPFLNLRNHKKLLIIDGKVAFAGGMNVMDDCLVESRPRHPVADTHFRFEGPVVTQLMDVFSHDWSFTTGERLEGPAWFPSWPVPDGEGAVARAIASGPDKDLEKIEMVLLEAIGCATQSIAIMTPYFLPHDQIVTALSLAALRNVDVDIIVPRRSNHRFVDWAMQAHIGPLLDRGVRFWYGKPPFNHSKLMVVDHRWSLVGSANWDMRSLRLNFELDVEVYSRELASQVETLIRNHQGDRLRPQELAGRNALVRLRDAGFRLLLPYI